MHQNGMGQQLCYAAVELVKAGGRIEHLARSGCRQGPCHHLLRVAIGQRSKRLGITLYVAHIQELRGHRARTHRRHRNASPLQFVSQAPGKTGDKGLRAAVHRHMGVGAERCNGADVDDPAARSHIGNGEVGHCRQSRDVQIRHGGLLGQFSLAHVPQIAAAGVVDEHRHLGLLRRQLIR